MCNFVPIEEVFLVRHGETEWNRTGRRQGQLDAPLTENGSAEIQRVAERIASLPIDGVFSSPLGRAITTAQAYAGILQQTITTIDDLREIHHGDMAGMTNEEIEKSISRPIDSAFTGKVPVAISKRRELRRR